MAQIGLQYLICSPLSETATTAEYADGRIMSKAIKADLSIEINEATLYGDNAIAENIKEFKSGKLTLNGDHIEYDTLALILGHTLENLTGSNQKLIAKGDDDGAFVGIGFYATTIKGRVRRYRAIWLRKVKFGVPNESLETKGDAINFQTPTVEGSILTDVMGVWKEEGTFSNETDAKNWLDMIANMKLQVAPVKATPSAGIYTEDQSTVVGAQLYCGSINRQVVLEERQGYEIVIAHATTTAGETWFAWGGNVRYQFGYDRAIFSGELTLGGTLRCSSVQVSNTYGLVVEGRTFYCNLTNILGVDRYILIANP